MPSLLKKGRVALTFFATQAVALERNGYLSCDDRNAILRHQILMGLIFASLTIRGYRLFGNFAGATFALMSAKYFLTAAIEYLNHPICNNSKLSVQNFSR